MEKYLVDFRKIERFADGRVRMSPIHTSKSYNDEMMDRFKSDLNRLVTSAQDAVRTNTATPTQLMN